ncbi:hypothetical protein E2C01_080057 [Portunus trituberculatus]|uniref:Uncharacterized protein n=1 Tax=Portunus trituberculatus TaxID=210409 RepID=A0A5B7IT05_PORTR|nr:hypothetical protein [Portunus trituberculatus]
MKTPKRAPLDKNLESAHRPDHGTQNAYIQKRLALSPRQISKATETTSRVVKSVSPVHNVEIL